MHTATRAAECATWSPDASKIAYCGHDGNWAVWVMNGDGTGQRQLTHTKLVQPAGTGGDYPATFSPDGTQLLYSGGQYACREIYATRVDGTDVRRLTTRPGADSPAAWLTDGRIVFSHFGGDAPLPHWFLMSATGTHVEPLPKLDAAGAAEPIDWLPQG